MGKQKTPRKAKSGSADARAWLEREFGPLTFGGAMSGIRSIEGATLLQFAARLGISAQHLSDVEKDRRGVSAFRAAQWARRLRHPPTLLVRLALQHELDAAGLKFKVSVEAA